MNSIQIEDLARVLANTIDSSEVEFEVKEPEVLTDRIVADNGLKSVDEKPKMSYMPAWIRKSMPWIVRTFTCFKICGSMEFFFNVPTRDMVVAR